MSECLNISASIFPLTSKASKALRMVSSSSAPPAIFSAKSMTICVKLTGQGPRRACLGPHRRRWTCRRRRRRDDVGGGQETVLVCVHDTEGFLELLDLPLAEEGEDVG